MAQYEQMQLFPTDNRPGGYFYLVELLHGPILKAGFSKDPWKMRRQFYGPILMTAAGRTVQEEREMHKRLAFLRIPGTREEYPNSRRFWVEAPAILTDYGPWEIYDTFARALMRGTPLDGED